MGAAPDNFDIIAHLHSKGLLPGGAKIADIGCQQLRGAMPSDVRRFLSHFGSKATRPSWHTLHPTTSSSASI